MANTRAVRTKMAAMNDRVAKRVLKRNLDNCKGDEDSADIADMFRKDYQDTLKISKLIRQNKLKQAWRVADYMDTGARDELSTTVYNWLEREGDSRPVAVYF